jgi:hypothetical protein
MGDLFCLLLFFFKNCNDISLKKENEHDHASSSQNLKNAIVLPQD